MPLVLPHQGLIKGGGLASNFIEQYNQSEGATASNIVNWDYTGFSSTPSSDDLIIALGAAYENNTIGGISFRADTNDLASNVRDFTTNRVAAGIGAQVWADFISSPEEGFSGYSRQVDDTYIMRMRTQRLSTLRDADETSGNTTTVTVSLDVAEGGFVAVVGVQRGAGVLSLDLGVDTEFGPFSIDSGSANCVFGYSENVGADATYDVRLTSTLSDHMIVLAATWESA